MLCSPILKSRLAAHRVTILLVVTLLCDLAFYRWGWYADRFQEFLLATIMHCIYLGIATALAWILFQKTRVVETLARFSPMGDRLTLLWLMLFLVLNAATIYRIQYWFTTPNLTVAAIPTWIIAIPGGLSFAAFLAKAKDQEGTVIAAAYLGFTIILLTIVPMTDSFFASVFSGAVTGYLYWRQRAIHAGRAHLLGGALIFSSALIWQKAELWTPALALTGFAFAFYFIITIRDSSSRELSSTSASAS